MTFQMGGRIIHLKAKSEWKKVSVPAADDFADLIEFQELNDYEFLDDLIKTSTKRKSKIEKQQDSYDEDATAFAEETTDKTVLKKKKKRRVEMQEDIELPVKMKKTTSEDTIGKVSVPANSAGKKKKSKKKIQLQNLADNNEIKKEAADDHQLDSANSLFSDSTIGVLEKIKKKNKMKKGRRKKIVPVEEQNSSAECDDETTAKIEAEEAAAENVGMVTEDDVVMDTEAESSLGRMDGWKGMGLSSELIQTLLEQGFVEPTPIQSIALPYAINHRLDIIGAAQTGSGKTLAFGLPILQYLLSNWADCKHPEGPVALILEPTRELAMQVYKHLKFAAARTLIRIMTVVGQMAVEKQQRLLARKPQVIVATPGRLWELIQSGENHLQNLQTVRQFVLDEADRLTETNHFEEVHNIISRLQINSKSKQRQHFIFSATLMLDHTKPQRLLKKMQKSDIKDAKQKLQDLVSELGIQGKPKYIDLSRKEGTADTLTETSISCQSTEKDLYLYFLLRKYGGRTLVFCNSKDCIRRLTSIFKLLGQNPLPLHSDMKQPQRLKNLDNFALNSPSLLLATDVAARGLDIKGVDHVVHYQVPFTVDKYIHRSGRTARASREGLSVILISPEESRMYRNILKLKEGEDLPTFPVDVHVLETLKAHVNLATKIDKEEYHLRKDRVHNNWMLRAAREADLELDDDLLVDYEKGDRARQEKRLRQQKQQLQSMLQKPLFPTAFSGRYPTQTGRLLLPKQFTTANSAIKDCSMLKKKRKK